MRTAAVAVEGAQAELRELSAKQALFSQKQALALMQSLCAEEIPALAARAAADNAALCAFCLYENGQRMFKNAGEAIEGLTLSQLALCVTHYKQAFMQQDEGYDEYSVNEGICLESERI